MSFWGSSRLIHPDNEEVDSASLPSMFSMQLVELMGTSVTSWEAGCQQAFPSS